MAWTACIPFECISLCRHDLGKPCGIRGDNASPLHVSVLPIPFGAPLDRGFVAGYVSKLLSPPKVLYGIRFSYPSLSICPIASCQSICTSASYRCSHFSYLAINGMKSHVRRGELHQSG